MAIVRSAGTEIIRSAFFEDLSSTNTILIKGVQHHIYTVLSIICHADVLNASGDYIRAFITGYDALEGTSASRCYIFKEEMNVPQTFVWNDKFSFNGFEPVDFAAGLDAIKQDAIADQGSGVAQQLEIGAEHASDRFDVHITYIDQNNA